jgi:hypothetical protein
MTAAICAAGVKPGEEVKKVNLQFLESQLF